MFIGSSIASAQQSWLKLREAQTMETFENIVSVVAVPGNEEQPPQVRHYPAGNLIGPFDVPFPKPRPPAWPTALAVSEADLQYNRDCRIHNNWMRFTMVLCNFFNRARFMYHSNKRFSSMLAFGD